MGRFEAAVPNKQFPGRYWAVDKASSWLRASHDPVAGLGSLPRAGVLPVPLNLSSTDPHTPLLWMISVAERRGDLQILRCMERECDCSSRPSPSTAAPPLGAWAHCMRVMREATSARPDESPFHLSVGVSVCPCVCVLCPSGELTMVWLSCMVSV